MIAYIVAMFTVGIPMMILELTLGQKMQRGSVQALRGIIPRLGGVGWAASLTAFVTVLAYNIMLGLSLFYFARSLTAKIPWDEENLVRPLSC